MFSPTVMLVLLLGLVGAVYSSSGTDTLWPLPNNNAVGTDMYTVDPKQFMFSPAGAGAGSDILKDAMARYMKLIFLPPPMQSIEAKVSGALEKLTITVDSADETLQLDTNNSCMCALTDYLYILHWKEYDTQADMYVHQHTIADTLDIHNNMLQAKTVYGALRG